MRHHNACWKLYLLVYTYSRNISCYPSFPALVGCVIPTLGVQQSSDDVRSSSLGIASDTTILFIIAVTCSLWMIMCIQGWSLMQNELSMYLCCPSLKILGVCMCFSCIRVYVIVILIITFALLKYKKSKSRCVYIHTPILIPSLTPTLIFPPNYLSAKRPNYWILDWRSRVVDVTIGIQAIKV